MKFLYCLHCFMWLKKEKIVKRYKSFILKKNTYGVLFRNMSFVNMNIF